MEEYDDVVMYRLEYFGNQEMLDNGHVRFDEVIFFPTGFDFRPSLNRFGFRKGTNWVKKSFYGMVGEEEGFDDPNNPIDTLCTVMINAVIRDAHNEIDGYGNFAAEWVYNTKHECGYDDIYIRLNNGYRAYDYETLMRHAKSLDYQGGSRKKEDYYIYRLFKKISDFRNGGECYIGISNNIRARMRQHLKSEKYFEWVQFIKVPSKEDALVVEQALIAFNPNAHLENKVKRSDYILCQTTGTHNDMKAFLCEKDGIALTDAEFNSLIHINEVICKG